MTDDHTEYRVMWFSAAYGKWFAHTPQPTADPSIADAWAEQAQWRGGRSGRVPVRIEQRSVTPWAVR